MPHTTIFTNIYYTSKENSRSLTVELVVTITRVEL